ncbi:MAG: hypothetical protein M0R33_20530 [Methylomonas sp.]|jgi:hypothetical protein|uniref:hypothetical protein n=1 Tax=Methylomonas sp. TaxID=418 RepID=UPI0025D4276B|nr:hypothetical protein [Methylomonas sp.]MCK9608833.1 hypothetical protein [Methylomonas sp.]
MEQKLEYVRSVSSWDSGGGIVVDVVELADGRVLGITDESVVLYPNMDALQDGEADNGAGMIALI